MPMDSADTATAPATPTMNLLRLMSSMSPSRSRSVGRDHTTMPYHVAIPAPTAIKVEATTGAVSAIGSESCATIPTRPATPNATIIGKGFDAEALPTSQPMITATVTMPIASTALSAVPNAEMAKSLSHDGEASTMAAPIDEMADGTDADIPAKSSVRPRDTATPATPAQPA